MKEAGAKWKKLTNAGKQPYYDKEREDDKVQQVAIARRGLFPGKKTATV